MRDLPQIIDYDKDQLSYALANALKERDEARDELKIALEQWELCIEQITKLKNDIVGLENKWKYAVEMAARAELERDYALDKLNDLKNILR